MKKTTNYLEIEEACNYPWVTTAEIRVILGGASKIKADAFRMELEAELDDEKAQAEFEENESLRLKLLANCFYYNDTRPHRLPIKRVLEKAHIDLNYVRREANKMRKARLLEGRILNEKID